MDIVGNLLPELAQRILLQLNSEDIEILWNDIEEWRHLFDNLFWKKVCQRNDYQEKEGYLTSDIYKECMLESSLHWRAIYKYNQLIVAHWNDGNFRFVSIEEDKQYDDINYFDDEILVASTVLSDSEVNVDITDLSTGKILFSFTEGTAIRKTVRHQGLLIFLNCKTLKLWSLETKSWFFDVKLEETEVFPESVHLDVYKNRLVYLHSEDYFYNVNLETKKVYLKKRCGVNCAINDVCFGDNIIILLCKNMHRIVALDLDGKALMKFNYRESLEIQDVMIKAGHVIICYANVDDENFCRVSVYSIQQDTKTLHEVSSINVLYRFKIFPNNNTILFGNYTRNFRRGITYTMWKFTTKNDTVDFDNYENQLESVAANNCYLFICHINSTLTVWCAETGKCIRMISDKVLKNSQVNFKVTENKLAYLNCDRFLCIQNFDFLESGIDEPSKP